MSAHRLAVLCSLLMLGCATPIQRLSVPAASDAGTCVLVQLDALGYGITSTNADTTAIRAVRGESPGAAPLPEELRTLEIRLHTTDAGRELEIRIPQSLPRADPTPGQATIGGRNPADPPATPQTLLDGRQIAAECGARGER